MFFLASRVTLRLSCSITQSLVDRERERERERERKNRMRMKRERSRGSQMNRWTALRTVQLQL